MTIDAMCAIIEQYIYQKKGVTIVCKPDLTSQRELFLLEACCNYILQQNGNVSFTWNV